MPSTKKGCSFFSEDEWLSCVFLCAITADNRSKELLNRWRTEVINNFEKTDERRITDKNEWDIVHSIEEGKKDDYLHFQSLCQRRYFLFSLGMEFDLISISSLKVLKVEVTKGSSQWSMITYRRGVLKAFWAPTPSNRAEAEAEMHESRHGSIGENVAYYEKVMEVNVNGYQFFSISLFVMKSFAKLGPWSFYSNLSIISYA